MDECVYAYLYQVVDAEVVDVCHAAANGLPHPHRASAATGEHRARQTVA